MTKVVRTILLFGLGIGLITAFEVLAPDGTIGVAKVVDGDTLEILGERIRFHGVDAPEGQQTCEADGRSWPCGREAASALEGRIGAGKVICESQGTDQYDRSLAVCYLDDLDLNGWMVSEGWALAYRRYSTAYVPQEDAARAAGTGMWRGEFVPPWEWRKDVRRGENAPSGDCVIKGNISRDGKRLYHVPGGDSYDDTRISLEKGERWFCSEAEAREAGWRQAR